MQRAFPLFFYAPSPTALCIALATVASSVVISERLPPAAAQAEVRSSATSLVLAQAQQWDEQTKGDLPPGQYTARHPVDAAVDDSADVIVVQPDPSSDSTSPWTASADDPEETDRDYLIATAAPGSTMLRQGPDVAIGRLHPEFVRRLAGAIREARQAGLPSVGIFSAYRPPAFGVGGFSNKFNSLHSYGLAVDMSGIGGPGSAEAKLWHEIAARHGVVCPYGFGNRAEWNHCQPTRLKIILPKSPLRETVTAQGPVDLESMFEAGNAVIANEADANETASSEPLDRVAAARVETTAKSFRAHARMEHHRVSWNPGLIKEEREQRAGRLRLARAEPVTAECEHRGRKEACRASGRKETDSTRSVHPRQASARSPRENETL
jgi:hypothetical protein